VAKIGGDTERIGGLLRMTTLNPSVANDAMADVLLTFFG